MLRPVMWYSSALVVPLVLFIALVEREAPGGPRAGGKSVVVEGEAGDEAAHIQIATRRRDGAYTKGGHLFDSTRVAGPPKLRLVINSHVLYSAPLESLLRSLERAHFGPHFRELLVVFGGSSADVGPHPAPGEWGKLGVTHINVTINAFDYNGLSALFHYKDHPQVKAHAYLYVHDTTLATEDFMTCFDRLASSIAGDELQIPHVPSSNIMALGHGVVEKYQGNFDWNFTKAEAVDLEWNRGNITERVKHISSFAGRVTELPRREENLPAEDPYNTGWPREKCRYPYFCLEKFVLMARYGDITSGGKKAGGKLQPNYNWTEIRLAKERGRSSS